MPVGIIDVGSNTVRLHVAHEGREVHREKVVLRLGESVERLGAIPPAKLDEAADAAERFVQSARRNGAESIEILVASPGRQAANGEELLARLEKAAGVPVRLLSPQEEGRLAFVGALAATRRGTRKLVAVCDVGGGSSQVAVGTRQDGIAWVRSADIGSMRLTSRVFDGDPPGEDAVARARAEVDKLLEGFLPPVPELAFAVGGSARAIRSIVGAELDAAELEEVTRILARTPAEEICDRYGLHLQRVQTLAAGAVILAALRERLHVPLRVVRGGGVREGAALELASRRAAA
ncbi:MAG TPA: hypothetical protein VG265_07150 [Gaiellaceae bacterium]|jgi:exopolyphosphatase/guanosine-5'-triphosphate,3'-diphosphate pyrophosphatase|nr:hypothetical protein [Gaiellaceae bacterium]